MKILTVVGARPQFIKAAVLSRQFSKMDNVDELIIHTGQHYDEQMSEVFFREMEIPYPAYNLSIHGLNHGAMTGQMMEGIEEIIIKEKPDCVLVYGDTNSTLAGALAAKKLHIKLAHVEAGLRSFNMQMPEEINRVITDRLSDILFVPTDAAIHNLKKEGFDHFPCKVMRTGDVMQDAAMYYSERTSGKVLPNRIFNKPYILCTLHRAENTDNISRLQTIAEAFNEIFNQFDIVLPLHPRTRRLMEESGIKLNFMTTDPVGYLEMIELLRNCKMVMTDSGGLQKEAFFFGRNCVTLRDRTEWVELVEHGSNMLAGGDVDSILNAFSVMLEKKCTFDVDLYGKGKAGEEIATQLVSYLSS